MGRTKYFEANSQCEEITRRLEEDLYLARRTIIRLMPDNVQEIMNAYYPCRSRQELYRWEHDAVEEIIKLANILSAEEGSHFSDRAYCPLCGEGTSSAYERSPWLKNRGSIETTIDVDSDAPSIELLVSMVEKPWLH